MKFKFLGAGLVASAVATTAGAQTSLLSGSGSAFDGAYLGGSAVYVQSDNFSDQNGLYPEHDFSGFSGGLQAGYNFNIGGVVIGPEVSFVATAMDGSAVSARPGVPAFGFPATNNTTETEISNLLNVNLRAGVEIVDSTLAYVTGGYSQADLSQTRTARNATTGTAVFGPITASDEITGTNYGIGLERNIAGSFRVGVEATRTDFGDNPLRVGSSVLNVDDLVIDQLKLKVSVPLN